MRSWVGRVGAIAALAALVALSGGAAAGVRAQSPANRVPYPAQLTLAPGDVVALYDPQPQPPPGAPADIAQDLQFGAATVAVTNDTDAPLDITADGKTLTLTGSAGAALQLTQHSTAPVSTGGGSVVLNVATVTIADGSTISADESPAHLERCAAVDAAADSARCAIPQQPVLSQTLAVDVATATGADRQADLQPGARVTFLLPAGDEAAALDVANNSHEQLQAQWDGTTLHAALPDGYILDGFASANGAPAGLRPLSDAGCVSDGGANTLACPVSGLPPGDVSFQAVLQLSQATIALPYSDAAGKGTLTLTPTGPDPARGGVTVSARLDRANGALSGGGVLRPWEDTGDIQIALSLADASGGTVLLEGVLHEENGAFAGRGYTLNLAARPPEGRWAVAEQGASPNFASEAVFAQAVEIVRETITADGVQGDDLSQLADAGNNGGGLFGILFGALGAGAQPAAKAGEPVDLQAQLDTPDPAVTHDAQYTFDFGDGSPLVTVGAARDDPFGGSLLAEHVYAQPGTYTIIVYRDDDSGVRTFGAAKLRVAPAGGS